MINDTIFKSIKEDKMLNFFLKLRTRFICKTKSVQPYEVGVDTITATIYVDREQSVPELVRDCGRIIYGYESDILSVPKCVGREVKATFFKFNRKKFKNLREEYISRGLRPDPFAQIVFNKQNLEFADLYPNGCNWRKDTYCQYNYSNPLYITACPNWDWYRMTICSSRKKEKGFWYPLPHNLGDGIDIERYLSIDDSDSSAVYDDYLWYMGVEDK